MTSAAWIKEMAEKLVRLAAHEGIVITIEQVNLQPPAMGNYATVVSVRESHATRRAREELAQRAKPKP